MSESSVVADALKAWYDRKEKEHIELRVSQELKDFITESGYMTKIGDTDDKVVGSRWAGQPILGPLQFVLGAAVNMSQQLIHGVIPPRLLPPELYVVFHAEPNKDTIEFANQLVKKVGEIEKDWPSTNTYFSPVRNFLSNHVIPVYLKPKTKGGS